MFASDSANVLRRRRESEVRGEDIPRAAAANHEQPSILQRSVMHNRSSVRSNSHHRIAPTQLFTAPAPPPSTPPPQAPQGGHNPFDLTAGSGPSWLAHRNVLPPFAEQPRPAPSPPKRPSRVAASRAAPLANDQTRSQGMHAHNEVAIGLEGPPVQDKALLEVPRPLRPLQKQKPPCHYSSSKAVVPIARSLTAPPTYVKKQSAASSSTVSSSNTDVHQPGVGSRSGRARRSFGNHSVHRVSPSSIRSVLPVSDGTIRSRSRSDAVGKLSRPRSPGSTQAQSKRQWKGETMGTLVDTAFFPVEELIYSKASAANQLRQSQMYRANLPPRLSFIEKDLPSTPTTSATQISPTELVKCSPASLLAPQDQDGRRRRSGMRNPLSQISENRFEKGNDGGLRLGAELAAIGEDAANEENVPPEPDSSLPTATRIHLRGGSIVTVTPPEMNAWRGSMYLHGPIMLPKPTIVPRKNSVASLEPFQEAVDQLYQHSLLMTRRRSDDTVVDDICEFFDGFGFDTVSFDGDGLGVTPDDLDESLELEIEPECFGTLPLEASPIEVIAAKGMLDSISNLWTRDTAPMPPVETEETLRARGIARLSRASTGPAVSLRRSSRKESLTLGKGESISQALLAPSLESGVFDNGHSESSNGRSTCRMDGITVPGPGGSTRVHVEDEIREISGNSVWVAPAAASKRSSVSKVSSTRRIGRNPIDKIRRAVASASTIL